MSLSGEVILTEQAHLNYMIEITTGAVFLMSSLYGSGQAAQIAQAPVTTPTVQVATSTPDSTLVNSNDVMAYVKQQYASEPLLIDIARCESTFRQFDTDGQVLRGRVNNGDVGVMQINEKYHADEAVKMNMNIYTVEGNVAFGKYLYDKYGAQPWISSSPCWDPGIARK